MAKNDTGVYQLPNKNWGYRYVLMVNGERKEARKTKDEFGAPFKTKREAIKARQAAIEQEQNSRRPKPTVRKTVAEVYQEYCEKDGAAKPTTPFASKKAYGSITCAPLLGNGTLMKSARRRSWTI